MTALQDLLRSFLHHLAHAFAPLLVGDADEIDALRQVGDVDLQHLTFALHRGHALAEGVDDFGGFQVFTDDSYNACSGVGVDGGES